MVVGVLRPNKDGSGWSICHACDENVGKKRCIHTLVGGSMKMNRVGNMNLLEDNNDISLEEAEKNVKERVQEISLKLDEKEKEEILEELREMMKK